MSVPRARRGVVFTEFERHMLNICKYTTERMNPVPSRLKDYIVPKISNPMYDAAARLILANEQSAKTEAGLKRRTELFDKALDDVIGVQTALFCYWNIMDTEQNSMDYWKDMLNREIALIYGVTKREDAKPMIITLPRQKMKKLDFLKVMSALHKYCYQKVGHAPQKCKDNISDAITMFADNALYHIAMANSKQPENKEQARRREEHLDACLRNLNAMQRPLFALWNLMDYSERIMDEWSGLINDEIKLIEGLKKSDRARYKDLPD